MEHEKWLYQATNGTAPTSAARKAGVPASTITRQLERGMLSAEVVIKIARAYNAPVLEGLVRCGIITEEEAKLRHTLEAVVLATVSDQQLLEELLRRVDADGKLAHPTFERPLDNLQEATITQLPPLSDKELGQTILNEPHTLAALHSYGEENEYDQ